MASITTPTPCKCCNYVACTTICQSKGGYATLCGFDEFGTPSNPPKRYRKKTHASSRRRCNFNLADGCGGPIQGSDAGIWDLVCTYNRDTCALTTSGHNKTLQDIGTCPASTEVSSSVDCAFVRTAGSPNYSFAGTPTETTLTAIPGCTGPTGSSLLSNTSGTEKITLTDEDTDEDAMARARAAIGSWTGCSHCDCYAWIQNRTGLGYTLGFQTVQMKVQWGAVVGVTYKATAKFGRRPLGSSGAFADTGSPHETTLSADNTSEETDWIDVPNESGFETAVIGCKVEKIS